MDFLDSKKISVPITIYQTLVNDAFYFGYTKNGYANLNGLLNYLIPILSKYREDMHGDFLKELKGNKKQTQIVEKCIYKVYFNKYDFCDDGTYNISFRINKDNSAFFTYVYDVLLNRFDMDFTEYIRSLLLEYCTKRLSQREYLYFYLWMDMLNNAIQRSYLCSFYVKETKLSFVPISMEISRSSKNFIVGMTEDKNYMYVVELSKLKKMTVNEDIRAEFSKEDCKNAYDFFQECVNQDENLLNEEDQCLD